MLCLIVYDCGAFTSTVLARSATEFERTLIKHPDSINERNSLGQVPLHLCAKWPWGTNQLLAVGAATDITNNDGLYPIDYASKLNDLESI